MSWLYKQRTGQLFDASGILLGVGYSGHTHGPLCDKIPDPAHGEGCNDPGKQSIKDVGPIPCGWYTIGEGINTSHGPMTLRLTPDDANEMHNRAGFLMHGDLIAAPGRKMASLGCIIQSYFARKTVSGSKDKRLQVVTGD